LAGISFPLTHMPTCLAHKGEEGFDLEALAKGLASGDAVNAAPSLPDCAECGPALSRQGRTLRVAPELAGHIADADSAPESKERPPHSGALF